MKFLAQLCPIVLVIQGSHAATEGCPYDYVEQGGNWADQSEDNALCAGNTQSPIDIDTSDTITATVPQNGQVSRVQALKITHPTPALFTLKNNGHTLAATPVDSEGNELKGDNAIAYLEGV